MMFYFSIPLDAPKAQDETSSAGFAIQGKRDYETREDRLAHAQQLHRRRHRGEMDHRRGRGRAGPRSRCASKDKSTNSQQQQQQAQAQQPAARQQ